MDCTDQRSHALIGDRVVDALTIAPSGNQPFVAQHRQLLWVMRPERSRAQASPAPLRLWLQPQGEELHVHVVKRRGPPLAQPVALPARTPVLAAALQAQAQWRRQVQAAAWGMGGRTPQEVEDALACLALATH